MRQLTIAAALLACSCALAACSDAVTEPDPSAFAVAYSYSPSNSLNDLHVWLATADGVTRRQLDTLPGAAFDPAWSPDGSRLAFSLDDGISTTPNEIIVMRLDGTVEHRLSRAGTSFGKPSWLSDGRRLLVTNQSAVRVAILSLEGGAYSEVLGTDGVFGTATISPDGQRVLWDCRTSATDRGICAVQLAVGTPSRIINDAAGPRFSPDGTRIAYVAPDGIRTATPDGADRRLVVPMTLTNYFNLPVSWTADGASLSYAGTLNQIRAFGDLYLATLQTGAVRPLLGIIAPQLAGSPHWSPAVVTRD